MNRRAVLRTVSLLVALNVGASAAFAEEGGVGGHPGTWLNWLYHVRIHGRPVVTDQAQLAFAWALLLVIALSAAAMIWGRRVSVRPGPFQAVLEMGLGALRSVVESSMGPRGAEFLPFIGSIFIYVLLMNLMGMIPGVIAPTANLSITAAMGVLIFCVVQIYGVKERGFGYIEHHFLEGLPLRELAGMPLFMKALFILLTPLIFIIHVVGEFIRPVSLSLRLFGNISGEEAVVGSLVGLMASTRYFFWVPVQLPNLALGLLTGVVQALIMSLLAAVYLGGVLRYEDSH